MPQEFCVVQCYKCQMFQVQFVKKTKKWPCKICNEKQSIKKVYGRGSGADCRQHVQYMNSHKGKLDEIKTQLRQATSVSVNTNRDTESHADNSDSGADNFDSRADNFNSGADNFHSEAKRTVPKESKWGQFVMKGTTPPAVDCDLSDDDDDGSTYVTQYDRGRKRKRFAQSTQSNAQSDVQNKQQYRKSRTNYPRNNCDDYDNTVPKYPNFQDHCVDRPISFSPNTSDPNCQLGKNKYATLSPQSRLCFETGSRISERRLSNHQQQQQQQHQQQQQQVVSSNKWSMFTDFEENAIEDINHSSNHHQQQRQQQQQQQQQEQQQVVSSNKWSMFTDNGENATEYAKTNYSNNPTKNTDPVKLLQNEHRMPGDVEQSSENTEYNNDSQHEEFGKEDILRNTNQPSTSQFDITRVKQVEGTFGSGYLESSQESDTSLKSTSLSTRPDMRPYVCFDDLEHCPIDGTSSQETEDDVIVGLCGKGGNSKWNMFTGRVKSYPCKVGTGSYSCKWGTGVKQMERVEHGDDGVGGCLKVEKSSNKITERKAPLSGDSRFNFNSTETFNRITDDKENSPLSIESSLKLNITMATTVNTDSTGINNRLWNVRASLNQRLPQVNKYDVKVKPDYDEDTSLTDMIDHAKPPLKEILPVANDGSGLNFKTDQIAEDSREVIVVGARALDMGMDKIFTDDEERNIGRLIVPVNSCIPKPEMEAGLFNIDDLSENDFDL